MIRDYEQLINDIKDEAICQCNEAFSSGLYLEGFIEDAFDRAIEERLEELRKNNAEEGTNIPVGKIENILESCKEKFSEIIDDIVSEALSAAEMEFSNKMEDTGYELEDVISEELNDMEAVS